MFIRKIGRIVLYPLAGIVVLAGVGAVSQPVFDSVNEGRHPPPGDLVAING